MQKTTTIIAVICAIFIFLGLMPVHGESEIYDSVVRLHVIANSDEDADQELKLKVRDVVLEEMKEIFSNSGCENIEDAERLVDENIDGITKVAKECIGREGYSYSVEVCMVEERYPTRDYELLAFPSGEYLSLQVKIGEAEGQNWWCVLFPPLCLSAATQPSVDTAETLVNIGLSGEQYKIITESNNVKYNVRFKILETFEGVLS